MVKLHCSKFRIITVFFWWSSFSDFYSNSWIEPPHDKTNKMTVHPAKTQISLGIRPVWSESSLCTQWVDRDPCFLHADSKNLSGWLSLHWAHTPFFWFCHEAAQLFFNFTGRKKKLGKHDKEFSPSGNEMLINSTFYLQNNKTVGLSPKFVDKDYRNVSRWHWILTLLCMFAHTYTCAFPHHGYL